LWAKKDSRPDENAKDPRGSAESDNSSRAWSDGAEAIIKDPVLYQISFNTVVVDDEVLSRLASIG
jgi:hypothetical protein